MGSSVSQDRVSPLLFVFFCLNPAELVRSWSLREHDGCSRRHDQFQRSLVPAPPFFLFRGASRSFARARWTVFCPSVPLEINDFRVRLSGSTRLCLVYVHTCAGRMHCVRGRYLPRMRVKTARAYLLADKALHVARVYVLFFLSSIPRSATKKPRTLRLK